MHVQFRIRDIALKQRVFGLDRSINVRQAVGELPIFAEKQRRVFEFFRRFRLLRCGLRRRAQQPNESSWRRPLGLSLRHCNVRCPPSLRLAPAYRCGLCVG